MRRMWGNLGCAHSEVFRKPVHEKQSNKQPICHIVFSLGELSYNHSTAEAILKLFVILLLQEEVTSSSTGQRSSARGTSKASYTVFALTVLPVILLSYSH